MCIRDRIEMAGEDLKGEQAASCLFRDVKAVSYTHLDVYKRQHTHSGNTRGATETRINR